MLRASSPAAARAECSAAALVLLLRIGSVREKQFDEGSRIDTGGIAGAG